MTIGQYHQHHSLRDEEDLFHSALSDEFDDNYTSQSNGNRKPWHPRTSQAERVPYELLDDMNPTNLDVKSMAAELSNKKSNLTKQQPQLGSETDLFPDALDEAFTTNMSRSPTKKAGNSFPDGLLDHCNDNVEEHIRKQKSSTMSQSSRYVEELHPNSNSNVFMNEKNDGNQAEYNLVTDDDYYSHMQYSDTGDPSRYPMDDSYRSHEEKRHKKVTWFHEESDDQPMVISPTGSDGELEAYQPISMCYARNKLYDDNDENSSSHYSDDNKSTGTFDRLYDEEYSGIYNTPLDNSEVGKSEYYKSPMTTESSLLPRINSEHSPDSVMDTPSSTGSFVGDLIYRTKQEDDRTGSRELIRNVEKHDQSLDEHAGDKLPTLLRSDQNVNVSRTTDLVQDHRKDSFILETPKAEEETCGNKKCYNTAKSVETESPQSNTTRSCSLGFESDEDSAIQELTRITREQQDQLHMTGRETQTNEISCGGEGMSRLEQWQQKQKQREEKRKQQMSTIYLPSKYKQESHHEVSLQTKQIDPPSLEPTVVSTEEPDGIRYFGEQGGANLFPDMEWDENGKVKEKPRSDKGTPNDEVANLSIISSGTEKIRRHKAPQPLISSHSTSDRTRIYRSGPNQSVPEELSMLESYSDNSKDQQRVVNHYKSGDDISVISVDTELRSLANQITHEIHSQPHPYSIKPKDSMESDMKLSSDNDEQQSASHPYNLLKRNDSMEQEMMIVDFDEAVQPIKHNGDVKNHMTRSVVSRPILERQDFVCSNLLKKEAENTIVADLHSYSDESEATNDPTVFPTRAVFQMNLGQYTSNKGGCESSDLIERACELLARGMNDDALMTLDNALNLTETAMDNVKKLMDDHYYNKERGLKPPTSEQLLNEEEYEDELDSDFRHVASEMADVINNIGVVQELNGDYQLAMTSFHKALEIYETMCHRRENTGDSDVDRVVSNIMHIGMAIKSRERREELHLDADDLDEMIKATDDVEEQIELRVERLNILMTVLDVEKESLGRNHPSVGFTLLKKGQLHLEMNHIDLAVKDIEDAVSILKEGLGSIHPSVGGALLFLADMFNYQGLYDPITDRNTALNLYQEAVGIFSESSNDSNTDLGLAHNSMGIIYASRGEYDLAMTSFYNALAGYGVRAKGVDSSKCQTHSDVAFVWLNVGDVHMENKEWQLALRSYLKAHSALSSLNGNERIHLHKYGGKMLTRDLISRSKGQYEDGEALLAFVLQNIAKAQSMLHKYGKSIEVLEEALRIHSVIDMRCKDRGQTNGWSKEVARLLENLGEVQLASGNITSAFDYYVESLKRLRMNGNCNNNCEVALVLSAIGHVHLKRGEYAEATVVLKECMRLFETIGVPQNNYRYKEVRSSLIDAELALMQNTSSTLASQRREISEFEYEDRALACDEIADAYKNKNDLNTAVWFYSEALSLRREMLKETSGGLKDSYLVDIGKTISTLADIYRNKREFEAGKILLQETKNIYESVGLNEEHPFYRDLSDKIDLLKRS